MSVFKTIICAINLTDHSDDIVYYTRELAKQNDAKVVVVHALPSVEHIRSFVTGSNVLNDIVKEAESKAKASLDEFVKKNFENVKTECVVTTESAANDILAVADQHCADLIVIGSLSTKGMLSFMNSKEHSTVIGKTRIPVMVVPNDLDMECTPKF